MGPDEIGQYGRDPEENGVQLAGPKNRRSYGTSLDYRRKWSAWNNNGVSDNFEID